MPKRSLQDRIRDLSPEVDFWSLREVKAKTENLSVRQGVVTPPCESQSNGFFVTVQHAGGVGYAASSNSSKAGLESALEQAKRWAEFSSKHPLFKAEILPKSKEIGQFKSTCKKKYFKSDLESRLDILREAAQKLKKDDRIVDWGASFSFTQSNEMYSNSQGAQIEQEFSFFLPDLYATAYVEGQSQTRTLMRDSFARQSGLELLGEINFNEKAKQIGEEAIELSLAENCPSGAMSLLLAPDQMMLQIHESIGHPIELDRILGDERNYAGTSFVTKDMFGSYKYGSDLLNVTFDPTRLGEHASYAFDDEGTKAEKEFVIKDGVLIRPLGGALSSARAEMPGLANSRANSWNRPPIDRMANLNLEVGDSKFEDMISSVEKGVYMKTNTSWSIDDSRNKFQFGCEWGRLIENGKLTKVVRNPNYRSISATFWRRLKMVGDEKTVGVYGTPFCGKGEPNQTIRVGHTSPACLFENIDVFGGEA